MQVVYTSAVGHAKLLLLFELALCQRRCSMSVRFLSQLTSFVLMRSKSHMHMFNESSCFSIGSYAIFSSTNDGYLSDSRCLRSQWRWDLDWRICTRRFDRREQYPPNEHDLKGNGSPRSLFSFRDLPEDNRVCTFTTSSLRNDARHTSFRRVA